MRIRLERHCGTGFMLLFGAASAACGQSSSDSIPENAKAETVNLVTPLADETFRAAASCPECSMVRQSQEVALPITGRRFTHAKLINPSTARQEIVALDATGAPVDAEALFRAERIARFNRQGRLSDELYALSQSSMTGPVPVWIWADVAGDHPDRKALTTDTKALSAYEAKRVANLQSVTSKVLNWLDARGYTTYTRGQFTPHIEADVPTTAMAELGHLDGVASVGLRKPEAPASTAWFDTVHGTGAHRVVGSASGIRFCNIDGVQPSSLANLSPIATEQVTTPGTHSQWTSELIASTAANFVMAPQAYFFMADGTTPPSGNGPTIQWCINQFSEGINYSIGQSGGAGPGGEGPVDLDFDYIATQLSPYPLITASAGNFGLCAGLDTVENRGYNYLVVGGLNDNGTTNTSDDSLFAINCGNSSSWRNWSTPHNDFELPNVVAPAQNVDSTNILGQNGTSASAPITLGAVLLVIAENTQFLYQPERSRAAVMATATHPVDPAPPVRTTNLPAGDLKQGAGALNAFALAVLAQSSNQHGPFDIGAYAGHYSKPYTFASDFSSAVNGLGGFSNDVYNIAINANGRLRVVIAWDATASGCINFPGTDCSGDTLDADLDLWVLNSAGTLVGWSSTWDSSWEIVDIPVTSGETYTARLRLLSNNASSTYAGIAWWNYRLANE